MGFLVLPILLVAMFYLIYMPQQKQKKQQQALLASLSDGDAVLTTGGIFGVISEVDADSIFLEVAPGIELRVSKAAVVRKVVEATEPTTDPK